ncbi:MAG: exodeoxyribonuclease III, partial [Candidatus Peregrinibacteria bacterium]|nr:exodeoxyribonuclease III [Candidatus Peregrinibacteria bacterium]
MKLISWNVNGIRAVERKGELEKLLTTYDPDIFLIQEIKSKPENLKAIEKKYGEKYEIFWHSAEKPGYAGTAIWTKKTSNTPQFSTSMPEFADTEGRIAKVELDNKIILSIYFPNGGKSDQAWLEKLTFYDDILKHTNELRKTGKEVIWAGDVNCAHEAIDLARPKDNEGKIGFHPEERKRITNFIKNNWLDIFREKHPEQIIYSWWHVITRARERNVGWRIDYFFCDKNSLGKV